MRQSTRQGRQVSTIAAWMCDRQHVYL